MWITSAVWFLGNNIWGKTAIFPLRHHRLDGCGRLPLLGQGSRQGAIQLQHFVCWRPCPKNVPDGGKREVWLAVHVTPEVEFREHSISERLDQVGLRVGLQELMMNLLLYGDVTQGAGSQAWLCHTVVGLVLLRGGSIVCGMFGLVLHAFLLARLEVFFASRQELIKSLISQVGQVPDQQLLDYLLPGLWRCDCGNTQQPSACFRHTANHSSLSNPSSSPDPGGGQGVTASMQQLFLSW